MRDKPNIIVREKRGKNGFYHNKYAIIDDKYLLSGSFNFSNNAKTRNFENMQIIQIEKTILNYIERFDKDWD